MQGKMKSFFEDTGIILVLSATIYGGYYFYTTFETDLKRDEIISENKIVLKDNINIKKQNSTFKNTQNINSAVESVSEISPAQIESTEIEKVYISKIDEKEVSKIETLKDEPSIGVESKSVLSEVLEEDILKQEMTNIKTKNKDSILDKVALKIFIQDVKNQINQNIKINNNIDENTNLNLKIRVTVLKDGNYEQLQFVNGDKELYDENKKNILKIFPLKMEENIKGAFPRYLRMTF